MECCGKPFSIGNNIEWPVCESNGTINSPVDVGTIDYFYEGHDYTQDKSFILSGVVDSIKILYEKYVPSQDDPIFYIPVSGKMIDVNMANIFEEAIDGMVASGYVICIRDYTIQKDEN